MDKLTAIYAVSADTVSEDVHTSELYSSLTVTRALVGVSLVTRGSRPVATSMRLRHSPQKHKNEYFVVCILKIFFNMM